MTLPRITIILIFSFGMLTGCETPLINVEVSSQIGAPTGGKPDDSGGACKPGTPWWACGVVHKHGVIKNIFDSDDRKVYEVEVAGEGQRLYFSDPPDDVQAGLKKNDTVAFTFEDHKSKLLKAQ